MALPSAPFRYAGNWNNATTYYRNDLVISPLANKAYVLLLDTLTGGSDPSASADWVLNPNLSQNTFGTYVEATGGNLDVSIPIIGLTATGTVSICYVHVGVGGGPQYLKTITNSANTCDMTFNQAVGIGDQIIWQVLAFS